MAAIFPLGAIAVIDRQATDRKYRIAAALEQRIAFAAVSMWTGRPKGRPVFLDQKQLTGDTIPETGDTSRWKGTCDWALPFADGSTATLQAMTLDDWYTSIAVVGSVSI